MALILLYSYSFLQANVEESAKDCKILNKIANNVAEIPALKQWLAERPVTMF